MLFRAIPRLPKTPDRVYSIVVATNSHARAIRSRLRLHESLRVSTAQTAVCKSNDYGNSRAERIESLTESGWLELSFVVPSVELSESSEVMIGSVRVIDPDSGQAISVSGVKSPSESLVLFAKVLPITVDVQLRGFLAVRAVLHERLSEIHLVRSPMQTIRVVGMPALRRGTVAHIRIGAITDGVCSRWTQRMRVCGDDLNFFPLEFGAHIAEFELAREEVVLSQRSTMVISGLTLRFDLTEGSKANLLFIIDERKVAKFESLLYAGGPISQKDSGR